METQWKARNSSRIKRRSLDAAKLQPIGQHFLVLPASLGERRRAKWRSTTIDPIVAGESDKVKVHEQTRCSFPRYGVSATWDERVMVNRRVHRSRARDVVPQLVRPHPSSFFTTPSTLLLGNRVTCSLRRRDDCARLTVTVEDPAREGGRSDKRTRSSRRAARYLARDRSACARPTSRPSRFRKV